MERPSVLVSPVPAARQARDLDSRVMGVTTVHGLCTVCFLFIHSLFTAQFSDRAQAEPGASERRAATRQGPTGPGYSAAARRRRARPSGPWTDAEGRQAPPTPAPQAVPHVTRVDYVSISSTRLERARPPVSRRPLYKKVDHRASR